MELIKNNNQKYIPCTIGDLYRQYNQGIFQGISVTLYKEGLVLLEQKISAEYRLLSQRKEDYFRFMYFEEICFTDQLLVSDSVDKVLGKLQDIVKVGFKENVKLLSRSEDYGLDKKEQELLSAAAMYVYHGLDLKENVHIMDESIQFSDIVKKRMREIRRGFRYAGKIYQKANFSELALLMAHINPPSVQIDYVLLDRLLVHDFLIHMYEEKKSVFTPILI